MDAPVLSIAQYNAIERQARRVVANSQIQGFQPVTFAHVGYPTNVRRESDLASYVDLLSLNPHTHVPYDTGKFFRGASLYASYSPDEAELINRVCDTVVTFTREWFGRPVKPVINTLNQMGMFRAVQAISALLGKKTLRILEIGPGFGYLGVYLALQGHTYYSFDVTQGLYLYQSRLMQAFFKDEFTEAATQVDFSEVRPNRIMHIPWWQFCRLYRSPPDVDIVIGNGVWGEMSRIAFLYSARLFQDMLKKADFPLIICNNFGNPIQNSPEGIAAEFASKGFTRILAPFDPDARLYTAACASCHYNATNAPLAARPDLALNSAVHLSDPSNLIQVILRGISAKEGMRDVVMPAFGGALSDADVARIAAYLRRTRTSLPPWPDLVAKIAEIRRMNGAAN